MKKIKITLEDVPNEYPRLDMNKIAFGSPEEVEKMQKDYVDAVKKTVIKRCMIVIVLIALVIFGLAAIGGYSVGAYASPNSSSQYAKHYVLNKNTKRFHYTWCEYVQRIAPGNKKEVKWKRTKAISHGYSPCGNCKP